MEAMPNKISREEAEKIIDKYVPLLKRLDKLSIEYCCCGGTGVLIHALCETDNIEFRATYDIDIFLPEDFNDFEIAKLYLSIYVPDSKTTEKMIDEILGKNAYKYLIESYNDVNLSLQSIEEGKTPKIDALRFLNGYTLNTIPKEKLNYKGYDITVATKEAILDMKQQTIHLFETQYLTEGRPRDYIDALLLKKMIEGI